MQIQSDWGQREAQNVNKKCNSSRVFGRPSTHSEIARASPQNSRNVHGRSAGPLSFSRSVSVPLAGPRGWPADGGVDEVRVLEPRPAGQHSRIRPPRREEYIQLFFGNVVTYLIVAVLRCVLEMRRNDLKIPTHIRAERENVLADAQRIRDF